MRRISYKIILASTCIILNLIVIVLYGYFFKLNYLSYLIYLLIFHTLTYILIKKVEGKINKIILLLINSSITIISIVLIIIDFRLSNLGH